MRRFAALLSTCLGACGDNVAPPPDAAAISTEFQTAPHAPMPAVSPHAGRVLSALQLVTVTFDDYRFRDEVGAFGDALVRSAWYRTIGAEYGLTSATHVSRGSLGPKPRALRRSDVRDLITRAITDGTLPPPAPGAATSQRLYLIYIPSSVIRGPGLTGIHGYHEMVTLDGVPFPIAVALDDFEDRNDLLATTAIAAQQVINAATNPYAPPIDGYYADPPVTDPWSLVHGEVAALCAGEPAVTEAGYTLPRAYSSAAAQAGKSPCLPYDGSDDSWTDVTARPSQLQRIPPGGTVTFELTGWSTRELPDWRLRTRVADNSAFPLEDMHPRLSSETVNNGRSVQLTLQAPPDAAAGDAGGVYVLSGTGQRPWAVGFIVQ
jgi:hypothetical protein